MLPIYLLYLQSVFIKILLMKCAGDGIIGLPFTQKKKNCA